jgi:hypothetical protein
VLPSAHSPRFSHFAFRSFLENHACVSDVVLTERAGVTARDLTGWEKTNLPIKLPADLRAFLQLFDGLELRWKIQFQGAYTWLLA